MPKLVNPDGRTVSMPKWMYDKYKSKKGWSEFSSEHPIHQGAGYYLLSDGSRVRGKDKAIEAENAIRRTISVS